MVRDDDYRASRPKRWLFAALLLFLGLAAVVWFAPQIVARTTLRDRIVPLLLPEYPGQVTFAAPRLSWLAPVQLNDVRVTDAGGELFLQAPRIASNQRLLDLIMRGASGLDVHIHQPRLVCHLRPDGSNVEDALQPLLGPSEGSTSINNITVRVDEGVVELHDDQAGLQGTLNDLQLTCQMQVDEAPLLISLTGNVTATDGSSGAVSARVEFAPSDSASDNSLTRGSGTLKSQQIPLAALQPIIRRFVQQGQIAGLFSSDLQAVWELAGGKPRIDVTGRVDGTQWSVADAQLLGQHPLRLTGLRSVVDVGWEAGLLHVRNCDVDSDLAQFVMKGDLDVNGLLRGGSSVLLAENDCRLQGRLNLAQLAAQLPQLLRLREDTQVTAGELVIDLTARTAQQTHQWQGSIVTNNLQAISGRRTLRWARPIQITLDARRPFDGELSGRLTCQSDFLQVDAEGSFSSATVAVRGNLDRLASDIRQLVDMGDLKVAGALKAGLEINRRQDGQFSANAHALLQDFQLEFPGRRPLHEQRLTLVVDTSGIAGRQGLVQLQRATVRLVSAGDQLDLQLLSPVARPLAQATWPVSLDLQGRLGSWLPRVQPWMPLSGWNVAGGVRLQATASLAADEAVIKQAKMTLQQLQASNGRVNITEPQVLLVTSGHWKQATGRIESDLTTLASSSLAIRADRVSITPPSDGTNLSLQGALAVQGDLARLHSWFSDGRSAPDTRYAGRLQANLRATSDASTTNADWDATIDQFAAYQQATPSGVSAQAPSRVQPVRQNNGWTTVWSEPKVVVSGSGSYDRPADRLVVRDIAVQSKALNVQQVSAQVEEVSAKAIVDMAGQYQYDLAALSRLLLPASANAVRISGRGSHPFRLSGPLADSTSASPGGSAWWTKLSAEAGAAWDSIDAYGLQVGKGEIEGRLSDGVVRCDPIQAALNGGRLNVSPVLQLTGNHKLLMVGEGRVLEQARITPQICQAWLQYVTPLLANATRAEGEFSVDLQRATIPLEVPRHSDVAGVLTIHAAQIRPGPMTEQLIRLAQQIEAIVKRKSLDATLTAARSTELNIDAQQVGFAVAKQWVHHQGFHVEIGDVMIRTSGAVGMDGALQMVAEVPVRESWVERDQYLKSLQGQTLKIPITGSVTRPKFDKRVLTDLTRQMAAGAASGVLQDAVNKGLQKGLDDLFKRGR